MAMARARRSVSRIDYWPGFVDALATLLLVFVFLLSMFILAQFFLGQEVTQQGHGARPPQRADRRADRAPGAGEGRQRATCRRRSPPCRPISTATEGERDRLQGLLDGAGQRGGRRRGPASRRWRASLESEQQVSQRALAQVELLNQQIAALRRQIGALEEALDASESRDRESQTRIADLGKRLNVALAQRVQELSRYRSDFFGRLREILAGRSDIQVVGDRFVLPASVLFASVQRRARRIVPRASSTSSPTRSWSWSSRSRRRSTG